jgi:hypothetical protein
VALEPARRVRNGQQQGRSGDVLGGHHSGRGKMSAIEVVGRGAAHRSVTERKIGRRFIRETGHAPVR